MNIITQFQNLFDPGTALGAFIISLLAGIVCSFIGGYKYCEHVKKTNIIEVDEIEGDVVQDCKGNKEDKKNQSSNVSKMNQIKSKKIVGNIQQDVEK